jgi:hypothetical protein
MSGPDGCARRRRSGEQYRRVVAINQQKDQSVEQE